MAGFDFDFILPPAAADVTPTLPPPAATGFIERIFHEILPAHMPGYEPREPQIQLAHLVARGLESGQHVTAEAGTGTGKSLAVLIPAVHYAVAQRLGQVVVSTGTIALQEQYAHKDVPFLQRVLEDAGVHFTAALAKGKSNYVCLSRLDDFSRMFGADPDQQTQRLLTWAETTATGDKAELTEEPGTAWQQICVDDSCTSSKCPLYDQCHYYKAKARWQEADILICNHKLLLTDIATGGFVLPPHTAVILDEAHHLEAEALDVFGAEVSNYRVPVLLNEAKKLLPADDQLLISTARAANADLFQAVVSGQRGQDRARLQPLTQEFVTEAILSLGAVAHALEAVGETKADNLASRAYEIINDLRVVTQPPAGEFVPWVEIARPKVPGEPPAKIVLHATPTDVASYLRDDLFGAGPVIMTSATLAADGRFDYLRKSVGCPASLEMAVESPFDYQQQGVLFIPRGLPDPKAPDYYPQITPLIEQLLLHTDGRAFVLFTSYRGMHEVYNSLAGRLRWTVLRQGDAPKAQLLEQFKQDGNAVLFATASFWEGIDVAGEALSAVIIDKLPFPSPGDPVVEAKCEAIKRRGGSDFRDYFLPEAIIRLRQGVGRLIRSKTDRGLVAILDSRLLSKGYGRQVIDSLPPFRRLSSLENIGLFFTGGGQGD